MAAGAVALADDRPARGPARRRGGGLLTAPAATVALGCHVLALLAGGGLALAFDRATLRAATWDDAARAHHLVELRAVHRRVGIALAASVASGLVLFARHAEAYVTSGLFWAKMALVGGLAANALVMLLAERDLREAAGPPDWRRLRACARASTTLWILVACAGAALGSLEPER